MTIAIKSLCREANEIAAAQGFRDEPRDLAVDIALIHSELSEALEESRHGRAPTETYFNAASTVGNGQKPEGIPSEFADVVIRVCEVCQHYGIDLEAAIKTKMAYNRTRAFRHGGKRI